VAARRITGWSGATSRIFTLATMGNAGVFQSSGVAAYLSRWWNSHMPRGATNRSASGSGYRGRIVRLHDVFELLTAGGRGDWWPDAPSLVALGSL